MCPVARGNRALARRSGLRPRLSGINSLMGGESVAAQHRALVTHNRDSKPPLTLSSFPRKRESIGLWRYESLDDQPFGC
jgi:hypothetical protein